MLSSIPIAITAGVVLGFLAGLGIGGGSLLMLWLTLAVNLPYPTARVINLLFFLPTALAACFFRWRQGQLPLKTVIPAIIAGCAGALIFTQAGKMIDITVLKKLFGGLLILTGLRELFYRPRKAR